MIGKTAVIGSVFLAVSACTTPMYTMPPGPSDYRLGYHDGCDAGYAYAGSPFYEASDKTEPERKDKPYLTGWQSGFERCRRSHQRLQAGISALLGPP